MRRRKVRWSPANFRAVSNWLSSFTGGTRFSARRLAARRPIYRYEDEFGNAFIVKFYGDDPVTQEEKFKRMDKEFRSINFLRERGLDKPPYLVVRAFGERSDLDFAIAEEEVRGDQLIELIVSAARRGTDISREVKALANLLSSIHRAAPSDNKWWIPDWKKRVTEAISPYKPADELFELGKEWVAFFPLPFSVVPLHGDPNPTNIAYDEGNIVAMDLQMFHYGYALEDVSEVAAELRHLFAQYANNPWLAEPYIGLLFSTYSKASGTSFADLTDFNPFYMGLWELEIASNPWISPGRRNWLVAEAYRCWKYGLLRLRR